MDGAKTDLKESPRTKANCFSLLFFWWMKDIFKRGTSASLKQEDLYAPMKPDESELLADDLEKHWRSEIIASKKENRKPKLINAIKNTFLRTYSIWGILIFIEQAVLKVLQPICLGYLISYFDPQSKMSSNEAWMAASFLIVLAVISLFINNHSTLALMQIGMRCRVACCSLVYRKLLRLSRVSQTHRASAGHLVNLMSNDVSRFDIAAEYLHYVWIMPVQAILIAYVIYRSVGLAMFAGVIAITIQSVALQSYLSRLAANLRLKIAHRTDERVRLMNELLNGIQVIKMYAWEEPFRKLVEKARKLEIRLVRKTNYIRGLSLAMMVFTEVTALYLTLVACVLLKQEIHGRIVFSLAQLYNILQLSMAIFYPMGMTYGGEALISVRRLQDFLLLEETSDIPADPTENHKSINGNSDIHKNGGFKSDSKVHQIDSARLSKNIEESENVTELDQLLIKEKQDDINPKININPRAGRIVLKNCKASWQGSSIADTLNLSLNLQKGVYCAVVGAVGSGKSSLLQLLLKELPVKSGTMLLEGTTSYSSQEAWLFPGTVKSNILFGLPYNKERYDKVVYACGLSVDFKQFPKGDDTIVGDRGSSLSGGQKARINLARAIYRTADIYLLDDPLSAVDGKVGQHIIKNCLRMKNGEENSEPSVLEGVTRIICTHQLHLLKDADVIVILSNGRIIQTGTYDEVSKSSLFNELLNEQAHGDPVESSGKIKDDLEKIDEEREIRKPSVSKKEEVLDNSTSEVKNEEQMGEGSIGWRMYYDYIHSGTTLCFLLSLLCVFILSQVVTSGSNYWVTFWTNQEEIQRALRRNNSLNDNSSVPFSFSNNLFDNIDLTENNSTNFTFASGPNLFEDSGFNLTFLDETDLFDYIEATNGGLLTKRVAIYVYTFLVGSCIILMILRSLLFFRICMSASKALHNTMFANILGTPMRFFHLNNAGRILNRFSKDIGSIDELLPRYILDALQIFCNTGGIFVMIGTVNPWVMILILPVGFLFMKLRGLYLKTAQNIKRLEGITRSPVFGHVTSTFSGLPTIRAAKAQTRLMQQFDHLQDGHTSAWYLSIAATNAFGFWLDIICIAFVACVTFSFLIFENDTMFSGSVGLAISQAMILTGMLQFGVRQTAEVVNQMTCVERIMDYTKLDQEISADNEPEKDWPKNGKVEFKDISLKYDPLSKPVLKNLNITIEPGWKVGVVGRTGAGKSSLIAALFRLAYNEGNICIDGLDTNDVSLRSLRSRISIIPQDPVLFCDTIRYNLDPFNLYSDLEIWSSLEDVELKDKIQGLDHAVSESGGNLSSGERQLICLARAILRNNRLLVLDEATANVDTKTDSLIQSTIRRKFSQCTVITIAHRLNTVMDSDRILVLDAGRMVEYGAPDELLKQEGSLLKQMWENKSQD